MSLPTIDARIASLEAALASGELTVESQGDRVTYRSVEDLRGALNYFREQRDEATAPSAARGTFGFSAVGFERD